MGVDNIVASEIRGVANDLLSNAPSIKITSHPIFSMSLHRSFNCLFIEGPANSTYPVFFAL